jgi:hypothetical protein
VREAQLAANVHSNNTKSIDTRPFLRSPASSPGNRAEPYHQNAATFLDISKAKGGGMLELYKQ